MWMAVWCSVVEVGKKLELKQGETENTGAWILQAQQKKRAREKGEKMSQERRGGGKYKVEKKAERLYREHQYMDRLRWCK